MRDAATHVLLYTHSSVALNMTVNKCLPPRGSLPETLAKEGKIHVGGCDH